MACWDMHGDCEHNLKANTRGAHQTDGNMQQVDSNSKARKFVLGEWGRWRAHPP